jgi:sugar phosphate isomerase/epimerase
MRFSICNETFRDWSWEESCKAAANAGYSGIEVAPFTLADDIRNLNATERKNIRDAAQTYGLEIVGLHWLLVSPSGLSCTDPDPAVRQNTREYMKALVDFCADMGGKVMVFGSPKQRLIASGETKETTSQMLLETLKPSLSFAEEYGISICLEPLPAEETNFLLTLQDAVDLIAKSESNACKTILDVKSASVETSPIPELIERFQHIIAHVHANDANRRGPGFGETDFRPILSSLKSIEYTGWVSVEVFDYSPDPITIAQKSLACLWKSFTEETG